MQVRPLGSLWDRSVTCSSYRKDRPVITNNIKPLGSSWDRSGVMVMNKVGGAGSAVLHLPYIIATRFITRWFRAHWDCMLWGESTFTPSHFQRRAPPFTCMYKWSSREIPVGKEGARSVVHLYRSVIVLLVLTFEETDRFSDRTGRFFGGGLVKLSST